MNDDAVPHLVVRMLPDCHPADVGNCSQRLNCERGRAMIHNLLSQPLHSLPWLIALRSLRARVTVDSFGGPTGAYKELNDR
jgi:hypothetical protein